MGAGGMKGQEGTINTMPEDVTGLRGDVISWLQQASGGNPGAAAEASFEKMFAKERLDYLAQLQKNGVTGPALLQAGAQFDSNKATRKEAYVKQNPGGSFGAINAQAAPMYNPAASGGSTIGNLPQAPKTNLGPASLSSFDPISAGAAAKGDPVSMGKTSGLQRDKNFDGIIDMIVGRSKGGNMAGQATAGQAASTVGMVQSMDQLGNSFFKENVMTPYRDMFAQTRKEGLAAANEASGNLTGSGFANNLGTTVNRSIGEENAALSGILTQLGQFEVGRQQQVAEREQGRLLGNAGFTTQAEIANAGNRTTANLAGTQNLAQLAALFSGESMDAAKRADGMSMFNAGESNKALMDFLGRSDTMSQFNTNQVNTSKTQQSIRNAELATQQAIEQGRITSAEATNYYNQQLQLNTKQAELDQNNNQFNAGETNKAGMFNTQNQTNVNQQNAQNFLQLLLGMSTTGVGPNQPSYKPGGWDAISQILPFIGTVVGSYYGAKKN